MATQIVRYEDQGQARWGVFENGWIHPLTTRAEALGEFLRHGAAEARDFRAREGDLRKNPAAVKILSPVTEPCRVLCQGLNFRDHVREAGGNPDRIGFNMMFRKSSTSIAPPDTDLVRPDHARLLDYELELGVVIGREIDLNTEISHENLSDYVAGILIANDVTARDIQIPQGQWYKGKSYPTFCPLGPILLLLGPDDIDLMYNLDLELRVNGEIRQKSNTREWITGPAETLHEAATFMRLSPGDLLLTGTPGGVAIKAPPKWLRALAGLFLDEAAQMRLFVKKQLKRPAYLKNGDVVESRIFSLQAGVDLGRQRNVVRAAQRTQTSRVEVGHGTM